MNKISKLLIALLILNPVSLLKAETQLSLKHRVDGIVIDIIHLHKLSKPEALKKLDDLNIQVDALIQDGISIDTEQEARLFTCIDTISEKQESLITGIEKINFDPNLVYVDVNTESII